MDRGRKGGGTGPNDLDAIFATKPSKVNPFVISSSGPAQQTGNALHFGAFLSRGSHAPRQRARGGPWASVRWMQQQ